MRILAVNAGSSTLKLSVIGPGDTTVAAETVPARDEAALGAFVTDHGPIDATVHRVVHGGRAFTAPVLIDDAVCEQIAALAPLAPLHQGHALHGIATVRSALPGVPAVACFDTAFHATLPPVTATYAVPPAWGVRRFGFHGLSHAWSARRIPSLVGPARRMVSCHLGSGSSVCAILDGRSVDTSMGFTPNEGVVMATRSGSVDPGVVLWAVREHGLEAVDQALSQESGLAALAGVGDMQEVVSAASRQEAEAQLALDVWTRRLAQWIAAMVVSLGGVDVLSFTGGIGEHAADLRLRVAGELAFLGVELDASANAVTEGDGAIGAGAVRCAVVSSREDLEMTRGAQAVLG